MAVVLTAARPELQSTHRHSQSANVEFIKLGGNPVRLINSSMHYGWKGTLIFVFIWALFVYMDERGPYMGLDEVIKIFWPLLQGFDVTPYGLAYDKNCTKPQCWLT